MMNSPRNGLSTLDHQRTSQQSKTSLHLLPRLLSSWITTLDSVSTIVRQSKGCVNCLHRSHQVAQCSSTFTCRTCKSKHHSLLHKDDNPPSTAPSHTTMMTSVKPTKSESNTPPKIVLKCGFIHTAMVTLINGDRSINVRDGMDTCSASCIMTECVASHLQLE